MSYLVDDSTMTLVRSREDWDGAVDTIDVGEVDMADNRGDEDDRAHAPLIDEYDDSDRHTSITEVPINHIPRIRE